MLLAVATASMWLLKARHHVYPDAPSGQFNCLSYTPRSDSRLGGADLRAQIERDLQQLVQRTHCVRTYAVSNGLDQVPAVARQLGMRVLLGLWIGPNANANETELQKGIAVAKANRDVIDAVIVGNEVLLRREQTAAALKTMLVRVHAATQLPVTYADVWDFWLKNRQLADAASFITIHILPYWEDDPVGIDAAIAHVDAIYRKTQQIFPGRAIYVGETGWPSAGRQREAAQPSLINQARFTREFIAYANQHQLPYNFIEAYDQPWKKSLEGTVGGYWGLYDAQGNEKFPLIGAVIEDTTWWRGLVSGFVGACLLLVGKRRGWLSLNLSQTLLAGFSWGALTMLQRDYLLRSNRDWLEWCAMSAFALLGHALFLSLCLVPEISSKLVRIIRLRSQSDALTGVGSLRLANIMLFPFLLCVGYINLGLVFNARYRDFPSLFLLLPAVMLWLQAGNFRVGAEAVLLCVWLIVSALISMGIEGPHNGDAWVWCALCVLLGGRVLQHHLVMQRLDAHQTQTP